MASVKEIPAENLFKFDGTNFQVWKYMTRNLLVASGLFDYVDGKNKMPCKNKVEETADGKTVTTPNEEKLVWEKNDAKAIYYLTHAMMPNQVKNFLTCTTSKEIWDKMKLVHEQNSQTNKTMLLQKFYACRMEVSESVVQFITKICNMANALKDVDEKLSDDAIISKILGSLPYKYSNFVTAWDSVDYEKQTIHTLHERLIKEESPIEKREKKWCLLLHIDKLVTTTIILIQGSV